ncbi:uncharacterized protein N7506_007939 [Penicillium brevicompactum]|uniref:uncharacterized protein n=1 Tax=Penicillium brevicompactum TaxID=5074 RepID=UPI00253FCB27|nr:uncharacterized protein N7506_007939 [Penicillium brevicompactum]KAJ5334156.1 hypothetical protein N7506_007939 [Penicillium brevicompactum]
MSTVPQGPVEARSLSSVTAIASNPPRLPSQSHPRKARSAVLVHYIFLSPLKPPTKSSVSAEAINASLYYLHVSSPEDDTLLQEVEEQREEEAQLRREQLEKAGADDPASREFARLNNVRRKPVGGDATSELPPVPPKHNVIPPAVPPRKPPMPQLTAENVSFAGTPIANGQSPQTYAVSEGAASETGVQSALPSRPLPPLPPGEESWANTPAAEDPQKRASRWSAFAGHIQSKGEVWRERYDALSSGRHSLDSPRPHLRPRSSHDRPGSPLRSPGQSPSRQRNANGTPISNAGFHLTLIRRDPTSGTQWNVATISTPRMDRNAVDIEISTPGYNRFAGSNEMPSLSNLAANIPTGIGRAGFQQALAAEQPKDQPKDQPTGPRKFHRQLCVSKPFDDSGADHNGHGPDNSRLKSGYYVFTSPWNGTCTFASSVNGRSLKCKHMIPTPAGFVPPTGEHEPPPAVTVAELRFNTPFQAANLHSHAHHAAHKPHPNHVSPFNQSQLQTQHLPRPNYDSENPSPDSPSNYASAKRGSFSQLLNPNTYSRPRAHSGPGSAPSVPANPADPRPPFNPSALLRRTSQRAQRFARQSQFYSPSQPHDYRSTSTSSGGMDCDVDSDEDRLDLSLARSRLAVGCGGRAPSLESW